MKKILLTLIILLLFTGCKVKYELNIDEKFINENISIYFENDQPDELAFYTPFAIKNGLYNKEFSNNILTYSFDYNYNNYSKALSIINCYSKFEFTNNKNIYKIYAGGAFQCIPYQKNDFEFYNYDELEIKFTTDFKVLNNNADLIDGKNYYWYITKENSSSKEIIFEFKKENKDTTYLLLVLGIMFAIVIITAIILVRKKNKNNAI